MPLFTLDDQETAEKLWDAAARWRRRATGRGDFVHHGFIEEGDAFLPEPVMRRYGLGVELQDADQQQNFHDLPETDEDED